MRHLSAVNPAIPLKAIDIKASKPLKQGQNQIIDLTISAHNNTEVMEIFTNQALTIHKLSIEGRKAVLTEPLKLGPNRRLLQYYFNAKKQLQLRLEIATDEHLDWQIQSHGMDLLSRPEFNLPVRPLHQMPKPFIKTDNTVVVQSFAFGLD